MKGLGSFIWFAPSGDQLSSPFLQEVESINQTFAEQQKAVQVLIKLCCFQYRIQLEVTQSFKATEKFKKQEIQKASLAALLKTVLNCIPKIIKEVGFDF